MRIYSNGEMLQVPPRGPAGPDGNPIGTIISYMGLTAPKDYLICDGATYLITDYPDLAAFFQAQFGIKNYFGGDGTTTFAVPDMRNLFLRGYHGEAEEQLSGDIGVEQEGTSHVYIYGSSAFYYPTMDKTNAPLKYDTSSPIQNTCMRVTASSAASETMRQYYTSRPVNMAVLYCIKVTESVQNSIDEYDTEDGWHVRKWADGYVEMTASFNHKISISDWVSWGNIYSVSADKLPLRSYPFSLSVIYSETLNVTPNTSAVMITSGLRESNNKTKHYGLCRGASMGTALDLVLNYFVVGRWK